MKLYKFSNKLVVRVKNKAVDFLKAYSSNTLDQPRNAFVNIKGQIVAIFDQLRLSDEEVLIVIEKQFFGRLETHLKKYLALAGTTLALESHRVYYDLTGDYPPGPGEYQILEKQGKLILTHREILPDVADEEFSLFRLKNNLPLQGVDYDQELLLNVADEELVSYTKGCYLGQEIIARVHHRSAPPKKLIVKAENECTEEEKNQVSSKMRDPHTGIVLGFLFIKNSP